MPIMRFEEQWVIAYAGDNPYACSMGTELRERLKLSTSEATTLHAGQLILDPAGTVLLMRGISIGPAGLYSVTVRHLDEPAHLD